MVSGFLIKENVLLDLFAMVFRKAQLIKRSMIWKNEHNFSIICRTKKEAVILP